MARKPRDFKAEYARRIARALEKGKTRQEARGHRKGEHIERREREKEELGITRDQMRRVFQWGEQRSFDIVDSTLSGQDYVEAAQRQGYEWFLAYRKNWEAIRRQYKAEQRRGRWESRGIGWLTNLSETLDLPDVSWLYYH